MKFGWILVPMCALAMLTFSLSSWGQSGDPDSRQDRETRRAQRRNRPEGAGGGGGRNRGLVPPPEVSALKAISVILGCPTDKSVVVSLLSAEAAEGYVEYSLTAAKYTGKTDKATLAAGKPVNITIGGLLANKHYYYRLRYRKVGEQAFAEGKECGFHTQRAPGSKFMFEIQGDSHPERQGKQFDPALYARTLSAAAADQPDFYMTIGDDFSVDALNTVTADTVRSVYLDQRPFLSLVGQSAPLFLVNGNHEQAAVCNLDGPANNVAVWAQTSRNTYFPQPAPDGFYTGDTQNIEHIGLLRDYFAWTWGDALFVVIDPYWHSANPVDNVFGGGAKSRDMWAITLGDAQYRWFKQTLEQSKAKFKFVFTHHVLGTGRGGIEMAGLCEWGGTDRRGYSEFASKRPGWDLPIHQLMAKNGVTIFFQGHDHIFAKQQLDGVVYQTLPSPADPNYTLINDNAYQTGDKLPGSGRVRVSVSSDNVKVEYVRSYLPGDETGDHKNGEVAYSYSLTGSSR